ncbi:DinB family protein [Bremerella sp. JC817]|uniref:DinB family protein n=1 Tax=Bremerella sp. JC817 TaxID=3231756 RepID=UPI00345A5618
MSMIERLQHQLQSARGFTCRILGDFQKPEDWVAQVCNQSNHALWFIGHMATTDNFFISLLAPEKQLAKDDYQEMFGLGSTPSPKLEDYPPIEEVRAYMDDRRQVLLEILGGLSDDDLSTKTPDGTPDFLADYGQVFETAIWHEGLHSGQLTMVRRSLGHLPTTPPPGSQQGV